MSEQECRAVQRDGETPPNPLFTPPCSCPRCAPAISYDRPGDDDGWLRLSGHRQRYRVEPLQLGATGRAALG